jgi:hypothetical protein
MLLRYVTRRKPLLWLISLRIPLFEISYFVSESTIDTAALVPCNVLHKGKGVTCTYSHFL